jgi:hypothetical protein
MLFLTTCQGPANKAVGIRLVTRGVIEIQFLECAGPVASLRLTKVLGEFAGDHDDRMLWQIIAKTPQELTIARPGTTPPGFSEVDPFEAGLRSAEDYSVTIRGGGGFPYFIGFRLGDLSKDRIMNGWGESLTELEFLAQESEVCGLPVRRSNRDKAVIPPVLAFMLIPLAGLACLGLVAGGLALLGRRAARSRSEKGKKPPA